MTTLGWNLAGIVLSLKMPEGHRHGAVSAAPELGCRVMVEHRSSPSCAALFCEPDVRLGHEVP